jgi:hypothetical protein
MGMFSIDEGMQIKVSEAARRTNRFIWKAMVRLVSIRSEKLGHPVLKIPPA